MNTAALVLVIIFFFSFLNPLHCKVLNGMNNSLLRHSNLANALVITCDSYIKKGMTINLVSPGRPSNNVTDFKHDLMSRASLNHDFVFRQETSGELPVESSRPRRGCIPLIESFTDFEEICVRLHPQLFKHNGFFVIVLISGEFTGIEDIFILLWRK